MEFKELIEARRSVRKYVPGEISEDEMSAIVDEALNAPSWRNTEVTRYYAAISAEAKDRLWKEALPSFNVTSTTNAAALVAMTFKKGESGYMGTAAANELGEMWGAYDSGLASAYFVLAAKNHGWDSLILGIRDAEKIKTLMDIPEDEVVTSVIALGKGGQSAAKPPRKPLGEVLKIG